MANYTSTHTGAVIDAAVTKITATSSSATELNLLDGVTSTTAEINILDGVTSTTAEINILDGVTATTAEINLLDGVTATTTELNLIDGVTATTAEINYIDGVTSNIQTQLNLKAPLAGASLTGTTSFQNLSDGTITITAFADEDDFSSDSATLLATQQSIKAYVDANVNTELIQDLVGAMFTSNTESGITVAYQDGDGTIDLTVATQSDNNFTTTLKNKLDAIEASADVTDTANVTSAGALMDSELTSIANVKALDQSVVSGATPTFTTTNFTDASNKRLMTDAQETKLDSVESSADVTDTANVTSAGALMDSELTDLAGVKGVTISTLQPKPSEGAFANGDKTKLDAIEAGATADQTDEEIQDVVGAMFSSNTETGITATYQDGDGTIDLVVGTLNQDTTGNAATATKIASITNSDIVQLTSSQTLTNKTLTSPVLNTGVSGSAILDEDNMASNSATKLSSQQSIKAYVDAEVAGVVDSSPAALNTLNELAAALGDDANFSTTTSTSLGNRLRVDTASQGLNGTQQANAITNLGITSTKAELNILDGVTATATELNLIDGVTATTAELNILDGVTSTAAELNILDGVTATAAELNIMDGVTATTAELNYTDGVTSNIQTQLDATLDTAGTGIDISSTTVSVDVSDFMANGADNRILTATGTDAMNAEANLTFTGSTLDIPNAGDWSYILNNTNSGGLRFGSKDSGGTLAYQIEISNTGNYVKLNEDVQIPATKKLYLDGGGNTYIYEDAADSVYMVVGGVNTMRFYESSSSGYAYVEDNHYLGAGSSIDVTIRHDGTNSYLRNETGNLVIRGRDDGYVTIDSHDGTESIVCDLKSEVKIKHAGTTVFETNSSGFQLPATKKLYFDGGGDTYIYEASADTLDFVVGGQQMLTMVEGGTDYVRVGDDILLGAGNSLDMYMKHTGGHSYIYNGTGTMHIVQQVDDGDLILMSDDGSGGETAYLTLDGSAGSILAAKPVFVGSGPQIQLDDVNNRILLQDNVSLSLGTGGDLFAYHDGSDTLVRNNTGGLYFDQLLDNGSIYFRSDNGLGGITNYYVVDGANEINKFYKHIRLPVDSQQISVGAGNDFQMMHDGTNSHLENLTGDLYITQHKDDKDIIFRCDDGTGGVTPYLTLDGSATLIAMHKNTYWNDDVKAYFGSHSDAYIYYEGTNDDLYIRNANGDTKIRNEATDADIIFSNDDGSGGNTNYMVLDGGQVRTHFYEQVRIADSKQLGIGNGDDLEIKHTSNHNYMKLNNGNLYFRDDADNNILIVYREGNGLQLTEGDFTIPATSKLRLDGATGGDTYIYEAGANVIDFVTAGSRTMQMANTYAYTEDNVLLGVGGDVNFYMKHDGTNSLLQNSTGDLTIKTTASNEDMIFSVNDGGSQINAIYIDSSNNGMVKLQNDLQKLTFGSGDDGVLYSYEDNFYVSNFTAGKDTIFTNLNSDSSSYVEIMRLDGSTSRVGIGTTSPAYKLDVAGSMRVIGGGEEVFRFQNGTTSNIQSIEMDASRFYIYNRTAGAFNSIAVLNSGSVGIGTTSPAEKLHVAGNIKIGDGNEIRIGDGNDLRFIHSSNTFMDNYTGHLYIRQHMSDHDIFFQVNDGGSTGQTVMCIDGSEQRVGIGTTSPSSKLDVVGDTEINGLLYVSDSNDIPVRLSSTDAGFAISMADSNSASATHNRIGVTTNDMTFHTNNSEALRIDSQRNLKFADNGTNPSAVANTAFMFNDGGELKVLDELGNTTTISPHNFELIPDGASEDMAFAYHSTRHTPEGKLKKVNVDMMKLARLVEELTGEKLVYTDEQ